MLGVLLDVEEENRAASPSRLGLSSSARGDEQQLCAVMKLESNFIAVSLIEMYFRELGQRSEPSSLPELDC